MIWALLGVCLLGLVALGLWFGRDRRRPVAKPVAGPEARGLLLLVDGSNVMHWGEGVPSMPVLRLVVQAIAARGFVPLVYFDANVGYKLADRYLSEAEIAAQFPGVQADQIVIVPGGQPADPHIIEAALRHQSRVVTNDRFMDWRAQYPAIREKGFLVKGRVAGDRVELRL